MPGRTTHTLEAESSRKRSRRVASRDSDDEDVAEVQGEARSSLRAEHRKRVRLSDDVGGHKSDSRFEAESTPNPSDHDAEAYEDEAPPSPRTPPKSQYELMRDNNFEHLRHEAADDQRATQRLRFRPNLLGENAIADNGIIESVTCVNFMCHVRLHCELGPLLNFIVGENGSGKSAILTAITLCLGGKASSTNRGGSLKSFVKEGCDRAILAVKIKNRGQDAYKPEIYGESVIVERHFSKTGASGFKVKTAVGQTYSTKKQEVDELVEYYALQVDNPLNILSQDNARQFLNSSTKTQKYKFFIEGVQLQQLDNDYRLISESLENMVAKVPDQEERVKHAKAALDKAQRMMEELEGNRQLRGKLRTLRHQLAWSQVIQEEEELRQREKKLAEAQSRVAEAEQEIEVKSHALDAAVDKVHRAEENLRLVKEEEGEIQDRVAQADHAFKKLKDEIEQLHIEERDAHQALKAKTDEVKNREQRITSEEERLKAAHGETHTIKVRELDEAKEEQKQIEREIQENKDREPELNKKVEDSKKALEKISNEIQRKQGEIDNVETRIKRLEGDRGSPYDAYEAKVPDLLRMIANENRFKEKPIGPLGTHIQLLKPQWSSILEKTFGINLNAFIVTSKSDESLLRGMMNRLNVRNCPVFIGSPHPLDISGKEPDPEYDTILRVLKIDNRIVRDQLIINHMIEQVILIPERVRAQQVMFDGAPPRNVKACLSFHDRKRGEGLRLAASNNGNISTSPIQPNPNLRPRMKTDSDSQLALLKESLQQLQTEYRGIEAERRRLQQDFQRSQIAVTQLKNDRKSLGSKLVNARRKVEALEDEVEELNQDGGVLQTLKEGLGELKDQLNHAGIQYGMLSAKKQDKGVEVKEAERKLKEQKLQMKDFEQRLSKAEAKLKQARDLRHLCLIEKNDVIERAADYVEQKNKAQGKRDRQEARVKDLSDQALMVSEGERVDIPEGETPNSIEKQYNTLRARLENAERRRGMSEQEVHHYFEETKKAYDKVQNDLQSIIRANNRLRESLTLRLEKWRKFQRYISSQSRANFIYLLSERGFRGKLLLDHERKALDLQVEPDRTEKRAAGRSTKTLSGGEKSFSSICLLLAIWEAMGSPLRCLDEFDVFMDNVNRAISTNMLITAARRSVNRQYIFITPNAIEGRNALDKDVKIIRLKDPRQRTLADY
ncbi:P-loop containing nucleoside triphosphate hydrolase protein [Achaetomium macrosporum]|uniref:P-loop containing nucleoside triphosphate hydrolase protein n=1 Tax=Achaetomium macrosporum TaxID=79813 RepID=A0AAN7HE89_9PEZI|nr:P-loop containing nucleoside triphosphate hydrolase protein [Achaetomium macrosporum]